MIRRLFKGRQRGFTLVELLVAVAITGTVGSALTGIIFSTVTNTDDNNGRVEAVTGITIAAQSISEDGIASQDYVISGTGNSVITLSWTQPAEESADNAEHAYEVVYSLSGSDIQRQCTIDGISPTTSVLAREVTSLTFTALESKAFKFTIESSGGGTRINEIREYDVSLRLSN